MSKPSSKSKKVQHKPGKQALSDLKKGKVQPVYYIYGDEPFVLNDLLTEVRGLINPQFKDFNFHSFTAGETSGAAVASASNQLPMMDKRVLIIVRAVHQFKSDDWESLLAYLENPSPDACLVMVDPNRKMSIDGRTKVGKALQKALAEFAVSCLKPWDNKMAQWLQDRARAHKIQLRRDVAERLLELQGTDLFALDNALERLTLYLGDEGEVTIELVDEIIAENRSYNVFDLSACVANRDLDGALHLLHGLMDNGEAPLKLLALLSKAFRELVKARVELDKGADSRDLMSFISPKIRFNRDQHLKKFVRQVRSFNLDELTRALHLMHKTDLSLKSTSGLTPELLMERLILELVPRHHTQR